VRPARSTLLAGGCLAALVLAATSPAWRLLLLGPDPTEDELLQLACRGRPPAIAGPASPFPASSPAR